MELASCHPCGALNFEAAARFFGKFVHLCFKQSCVDVGSCKDGGKTSYLIKGV